jgi:anthranilate synthase component 2
MKKKIVIIDNYDSFTYNLVHIIEQIQGHKIDVYRNDEITVEECERYDYIIISPGPGLPQESGHTMDIIKTYFKTKKIFGVCLGLQAMIEVFGGSLKNLSKVFHGIETPMRIIQESPIYNGVTPEFVAGRYHSWVAERENFPVDLLIDCIDDQNEIMGIHHKDYPMYAVQFHPESIMTPDGPQLLKNFLSL